MKALNSEIIGSQEVSFQELRKENSYIVDTSIMAMDCEESETNALTNKSSVPGSKQSVGLRYIKMYIHSIRWNPIHQIMIINAFLFHILFF